MKCFAADGSAAAPAEVAPLLSHLRDDGGVPGREHVARESALIGEKPAIRGGRADFWVSERRDHVSEPAASEARIGIHENENFERVADFLHGGAQVVDFFSAAFGSAGDDDVSGFLLRGADAVNDRARGIESAGEDEENFVIGVVEMQQSCEVAFEAWL